MLNLVALTAVLVVAANPCASKEIVGARTYINNQDAAFHAKFHQNVDGHCTIISMEWVRKFRGFKDESLDALHISKKAASQPVADTMQVPRDNSNIVEIYGRREEVVRAHVHLYCKTSEVVQPLSLDNLNQEEVPEIQKIVDGGDQTNRIDVVFMGDGYTTEEHDQFFDDMDRLTQEMFAGVTFRSYLPLFNIWAVYVPSVESGIGYNGAKNTAFRLYREAGQLRGIFPGNASYARTVCRMTGASGCDYPSLIGNDDYYGGLGGEFVISTKSDRTGTVVLRHEMGHNFVNVGEEYDNGGVYRGVNSATSVANLGWTHWLSGTQREERAMYRLLEYPWYELWQGERGFNFVSDGLYSRWLIKVSVSAAGEEDSLEFVLDGNVLPWTSSGYDDREFYTWRSDEGFTNGAHRFSVRSKTNGTNPDIPRMICSVTIHEFGSEDEFKMSDDYVSAYPTWDVSRRKTFRPTNEGCLMRNMTYPTLCSICKEGMWYEFFNTVSLIDSVTVETGNPDAPRSVTLNTLKVAHFRQPGNEMEDEELKVRWFKDNVQQEALADQFEILAEPGSWRVEADFITPEVRSDPRNLLKDSVIFTV